MLLKDKNVAIIGAGPVGLTMARMLQQKGIAVTVYERDKDPLARIWGGTLDLHENSGQETMKMAGLLEKYFALAKPMGRKVVDEKCNLLFSVPPQYDTPEINRNDLKKMLLDSLNRDTVVWDRKFTSLEAHHGEWLLHFEDKEEATADVVIGANGGMSRVRNYVTDTAIEYTGSFIIQGEVHQPEINCKPFFELCDNNILMTAGESKTFTANPDNNSALTYAISFRMPPEWIQDNELNFQDRDQIITFLSNMFPHWHECYHQLFLATSFFAGLPTRKLPLNKPWKNDRPLPITLIGDAAHIMPPFAGQGVNTGLIDVFNLTGNLTSGKFETIDAAIYDYEQKMFTYAAKAQLETSNNEIAMHHPDYSIKQRFSN